MEQETQERGQTEEDNQETEEGIIEQNDMRIRAKPKRAHKIKQRDGYCNRGRHKGRAKQKETNRGDRQMDSTYNRTA